MYEPSRRGFLGAAAAAGVAVAGGAKLRGADQADADAARGDQRAPLRWGIIGTGTRGRWTHVPAIKAAPGSELVALCDVAADRLQAAASDAGRPIATYGDYQKLLADPNVNAVVIATPNLLHREMLAAVLQAGKHVLCEKPAGASPEDASAMRRLVESASSKTVVMFGMQYRHHPRQRQVKELIDAGRIGKPRYIVQNCSRGDWNMSPGVWQYADPKLDGGRPRNWRLSHAATGGTLNEFSCHYFDLLHWMAGALPERITSDGGIAAYHDGRDTWDHATVTLNYPGGLSAVHTLCLFGPNRNDLCVVGDEGSITTKPNGLEVVMRGAKGKAERNQQLPYPAEPKQGNADPAVLRLYEDFLACVKDGKKPQADIARAVAASHTCWLAELSTERAAAVKWGDLPSS